MTPPAAQLAVLQALVDLTDARGQPPTIRAICARVDRSTNAVHQQLQRLQRAGYVERRESPQRMWVATLAGRAIAHDDGPSSCPTCRRPW